jgi:membrane protease YdiL (CAAX protease family)
MSRQLPTFFALTFAITWGCWLAASALMAAGMPEPITGSLVLLGTFTPGLVALLLTRRAAGPAGMQTLLGRITRWEVGARWYVFAMAFMVTVKLMVAVILRLTTGTWPRFGTEPWYLLAGAILFSTWVQAGEELGWRGYALPRLAARFGLGPASLGLGVIWATWHLPLFFFFPAADTFGQSFFIYLLQVTALSVAMAWLYWRTAGSLLLVMVLHAAVNNTKGIVPSVEPGASNSASLSASPVAWLTAVLMWLAAAFFLARMRNVRALPGA